MNSTIVGHDANSAEYPALHWVDTMIGNVKNAMHGTCYAIRAKLLLRYLTKFHYPINRRYNLPNLISRFLSVAVRAPNEPQRLLTMADVRW